jgi:hypothetical protein
MIRTIEGAIRGTCASLLIAVALGGAAVAEPLDEALFAEALKAHTRAVADEARVRVDYRGLARSEDWPRVLANLASARPDALPSRAARLAFWINAYNILAIQVVLDHYPIDGIRDARSLLRPVWKRDAGVVGGRKVSLGWIEHEVLRPLGEPRIHAAIVCASVSCPALRREPFRAPQLDDQLDDAMRRLLADPDKGLRIDREREILWLSRIFDWFSDDFEDAGGIVAVARRYASDADRAWLARHPDARVRFLDYDWRLNDLARASYPAN